MGAGERFATAFFFSVGMLATIGYGTIAPVRCCEGWIDSGVRRDRHLKGLTSSRSLCTFMNAVTMT
jgi:hypothetical protein